MSVLNVALSLSLSLSVSLSVPWSMLLLLLLLEEECFLGCYVGCYCRSRIVGYDSGGRRERSTHEVFSVCAHRQERRSRVLYRVSCLLLFRGRVALLGGRRRVVCRQPWVCQ